MKLLFGWYIAGEHHYFKSKRVEYILRVWHPVKYKKPEKSQFPIDALEQI